MNINYILILIGISYGNMVCPDNFPVILSNSRLEECNKEFINKEFIDVVMGMIRNNHTELSKMSVEYAVQYFRKFESGSLPSYVANLLRVHGMEEAFGILQKNQDRITKSVIMDLANPEYQRHVNYAVRSDKIPYKRHYNSIERAAYHAVIVLIGRAISAQDLARKSRLQQGQKGACKKARAENYCNYIISCCIQGDSKNIGNILGLLFGNMPNQAPLTLMNSARHLATNPFMSNTDGGFAFYVPARLKLKMSPQISDQGGNADNEEIEITYLQDKK